MISSKTVSATSLRRRGKKANLVTREIGTRRAEDTQPEIINVTTFSHVGLAFY
jgi:hypothetical protein